MRDGPRRLPLIGVGALAVLIALMLTGTYLYLATRPLVDTGASGAGGEATEVFTVDGSWDLRWSYDCSPSLSDLPCHLIVAVKQYPDCAVSLANQGINVHGGKSQGVVHNRAGGTFYLLIEFVGTWNVTVTGSGRASGEGPAPQCSEG